MPSIPQESRSDEFKALFGAIEANESYGELTIQFKKGKVVRVVFADESLSLTDAHQKLVRTHEDEPGGNHARKNIHQNGYHS